MKVIFQVVQLHDVNITLLLSKKWNFFFKN
jgi:hypothetical protein